MGGRIVEKEKSCLVTQNLIGAVEWYLTAPNVVIKAEKGGDGKITWKEKALIDLSNIINRVKGDFPETARRGMIFEKAIYENANREVLTGSKEFQQICKEVQGYVFFQKAGKTLTIDDNQVYFYAKFDAVKDIGEGADIKDIKTTAHYKKGKYLNGCQHEIYCYVKGVRSFEYIIAEWGEYPQIKGVHKESYIAPERLEEILIDKVRDCFSTLKDLSLWEAYRKTYCLY